MDETSNTEWLDEVYELVEEQRDRELSSLEPFVLLEDGTKKSAIELTSEEICSLALA